MITYKDLLSQPLVKCPKIDRICRMSCCHVYCVLSDNCDFEIEDEKCLATAEDKG